jgi:hypothetical protein
MKYLGFVLLSIAITLLAIVVAQNYTAQANTAFVPIQWFGSGDNASTPLGYGPALGIQEIRLSNGVTCYVMSGMATITEVESLNQVLPLGCVK